MNQKDENPKVFISYSQDTLSFSNKVLEFANKLRSEGIDVILDQYEEAPKEGWPRWMERNIDQADYVLVIATQGYYNKVYGEVPEGKGKGAKWEGNIIYQKLYNSDSLNRKFIPVVFDSKDYQYIPTPLQGSTFYKICESDEYDKLYWRLRGVVTKVKPPLGKLRPLPAKERKTLFFTSMIDVDMWNKAVWRGAGFMIGYLPLPTLILPFVNEIAAKKIFADWMKFVGDDDKNDDIRIALVEGKVIGEPDGYYIVIGTNIDEAVKRAERNGLSKEEIIIMNISRIIRANPTDDFRCYNYFKEVYEEKQEYYLIPAVVDEKNGMIKPLPKYKIHKRKLIYRDIKDIGENDEDAVLLKRQNSNE